MHLVDIINDIDRQDLRRTEGAFRALVSHSTEAPIIGATPTTLTRALEYACKALRNDTTLMPKSTIESIMATSGALPSTTYQAGAAAVGARIDRWAERFTGGRDQFGSVGRSFAGGGDGVPTSMP